MPDRTHIELEATQRERHRGRLGELAAVFLRLGAISFGGPAGHIALMEDELVRRRGWLSREKFLDLLGAVNLLPGPNSTEMALYIGLLRAGGAGLLVAGISFILPAAILVTAMAVAYLRFGMLPQAVGVLYGAKPVIIAVVLQALWGLGRTAVKTRFLAVTGIAAAAAALLGVDPLLILFAAGCIVVLRRWLMRPTTPHIPLLGFFLVQPRRHQRPPARQRSVLGRCFFISSRSARSSSEAAICCWPFCVPTWSSAGTG